jgi:glycosyltransferase involved in cell wall biosynthesis
MRICYIAEASSIHTQKWVKYFADCGHELHLISRKPFEANDIKGLNSYWLTSFRYPVLLRYPYDIIKVRRLIKEIKPDVLHVHYAVGYGLLGALSGFHPFILSVWGSDILVAPKQSRIYKLTVELAIRRADVIHCDADHIIAPLIKLGAKPEKIKRIYFGVDTRKFKPIQGKEKLRRELGIPDSPTVISLRSLEPIYDIETLINSMPMVLKEIPEAKFLVVGGGSQEAKLKEQAKSLGISQSVKFTGRIPNDELPEYLSSADIYVSTSLSDAGLAGSTAEAMACGLPVIITDFGDNGKWVEDEINGFLIPLRDPEALASKIIQLIRDEEIRDRFGRINRQIIEERNDWQKEMRKIEELYESLMIRSKK